MTFAVGDVKSMYHHWIAIGITFVGCVALVTLSML